MVDHYPDAPGFKAGSPETAIMAARSMKPYAGTIAEKIRAVISDALVDQC